MPAAAAGAGALLGGLLGALLTALGVWVSPRWTTTRRRSWEYAVSLIAGGGISALAAWSTDPGPILPGGVPAEVIQGALFVAVLITASLVDLHDRIIPNELMAFALVAGLPFAGMQGWGSTLVGAAVGFTLLLVLALVYPGGMGMGDVKLAGIMGLFLGWPDITVALMLSFIAGGAVSLLLLLLRLASRKDHIPFGPFLATGALLALLWGPALLDWWLYR